MPCDTVIRANVRLKVKHRGVLAEALAADKNFANVLVTDSEIAFTVDGARVRIVNDGAEMVLTMTGSRYVVGQVSERLAARVQQTYAQHILEKTSRRRGWQYERTSERTGRLIRRTMAVAALALLGATVADAHHEEMTRTAVASFDVLAPALAVAFATAAAWLRSKIGGNDK